VIVVWLLEFCPILARTRTWKVPGSGVFQACLIVGFVGSLFAIGFFKLRKFFKTRCCRGILLGLPLIQQLVPLILTESRYDVLGRKFFLVALRT